MPKHFDFRGLDNLGEIEEVRELIRNYSSNPNKERLTSRKFDHHVIAKILIENHRFVNVNKMIYVWSDQHEHYFPFTLDYADWFIRNNVPNKARNLINTSSINNIFKWITTNKKVLQNSNKMQTNLCNYIIFNNGIFNIKKGTLKKHDPDLFYTSKLSLNYNSQESITDTHFNNFINDITNKDDKLILRLQELFGYVISEVRDVKYLPFFVGPKDTGKSILLRLLERIIGEDNCTNLSIDQLKQKEFLAELASRKLNTCGEIAELNLKRLDILKKLTGTDAVMARSLHSDPIKFRNNAVLLFAGNHLPNTAGIDHSNAFTDRLVIFPFNNPIPKGKQDINLLKKFENEYANIINWAIKGFIRWKKNNYIFTECKSVEIMTLNLKRQNNSLNFFLEEACKLKPKAKTHNCNLIKAYHNYCEKIGTSPISDQAFHKNLKLNYSLEYTRFRLKGKNKWGYHGIKIKKAKKGE